MPPRRSSSELSAVARCRSPDLLLGLGNFALSGVVLKSVIWVVRDAFGVEDNGRDDEDRSPGGRTEGEVDMELLSDAGILYPLGRLGVGISLSSS